MIVGPWAKPKIYPDIKGILENPEAALQRFKQFGTDITKLPGLDKAGAFKGVIKDGKVNKDALIEGIGGLLSGSQPAATEPAAPAAPAAQPQAAAPPQAPAQPEPIVKDGKVNKDALIQGLGGLLTGNEPTPQQPQAAPAPQPAPKPTAQPQAQKKTPAQIKAERKREQKRQAEEAAQQLLNNFFGGH
jgi:hypothetical protein